MTSDFIAVIYSTTVVMFSSLTDWRPLAYESSNPAAISFIFLSNIGEEKDLMAVVVVLVEDNYNNLRREAFLHYISIVTSHTYLLVSWFQSVYVLTTP